MTSFDQNKENELMKDAFLWKPINRREIGCQLEEVDWADYRLLVEPKRNKK